MRKETRAILQMLLCAALWSTAGVLMKFIPWNAFTLAGLRSLIAGATVAVYMRLAGISFTRNRKTLLAGILNASVYICFTLANKLTTAASAIVLQFTDPIFIILLSALLFHSKPRRADVIAVLATLSGIALFFFDELTAGHLLGNCIAILSGMFMASMYLCVGRLSEEERFSGILLGQAFTFLFGIPFIVFRPPLLTGATLLFLVLLGVFQLGFSYILLAKATLYCPPLACALLAALEPLLNPLWVLLFYGERPGPYAAVGGIVVIASVTLWCIFGKERGEDRA